MRSKLDGPNGGADDYVTKPFSIAELAAKVHTRLCWREEAGTPLEAGALTLDLATHRARFADMKPLAPSGLAARVWGSNIPIRHRNPSFHGIALHSVECFRSILSAMPRVGSDASLTLGVNLWCRGGHLERPSFSQVPSNDGVREVSLHGSPEFGVIESEGCWCRVTVPSARSSRSALRGMRRYFAR